MQFLKNTFNHYILENNAPFYLLAAIGLALLLWLGSSFWEPKLRKLIQSERLPQQDWFYFLLIGFISFFLFAVHAFVYGFPLPANGDEYAYLLMAKTFASGRITNPAHSLEQFFDNFHLLVKPTYTGKYPPAQAAFLAIGIIFFKHPIVGVWISGMLAAIACFWMLRAFLSLNWSLCGALLAITHPTIFNWNYGYYYGNAGLIGGALCIGSLLRIVKTQETRDAVIFAVGIAILANSRPYEGLLTCLPLGAVIIYCVIKQRKNTKALRQWLFKFAVPVTFVMLLNFAWMGYYNFRATGSALKLPYSLYTEEYDPIPLFLPLTSPPVPDQEFRDRMVANFVANQNTRNPLMKIFHINEIDVYYVDTLAALSIRSNNNVLFFLLKRMAKNLFEFLYNSVALYLSILISGVYVFRSNKKYLFFAAAFFFCLFLEGFATYNQNHYYAPFIPFLIAAVTSTLAIASQQLRSASSRNLLISLSLAMIFVQTAWLFSNNVITFRTYISKKAKLQAVFEKSFINLPGKHLIVIDYFTGNQESSDGRWIFLTSRAFYNEPDIDQSKIVWANSLGEANNQQLFDYFKDRHVWILGFEKTDPLVQPKVISCEELIPENQPSAELEVVLRNSCPKQKEQ